MTTSALESLEAATFGCQPAAFVTAAIASMTGSAVPVLVDVLDPEGDRVHAGGVGEFVDHLLTGKRGVRATPARIQPPLTQLPSLGKPLSR